MNKQTIPAIWQAVLVVVAAYLIFRFAFPPLMPKSLMILFMVITIAGVLLYFSFDDQRWEEFMVPIIATLREEKYGLLRSTLLVLIPGLVIYIVYHAVKPSFDAPVELRQVHPAPPSNLNVFNKHYNLTDLENPVRNSMLKQIKGDKEAAIQIYKDAVMAGSEVYYKNCFYCHGGLLDGDGPFAQAFNPLPTNFQDVGTIAQLQEAFLFWRITTGGSGLPREGTPWNSAMPVWHEMLKEKDIWNVIIFLYDYVGQVPRIWNKDQSKLVTSIKDELNAQRRTMMNKELYQHRCAACHGEEGLGDGPAADYLYPRPRDFSTGVFKYKSSPGTVPPLDDDIFNTIKFGLNSTGMPGWATLLNDDQIRSLIPVLKSFDISATWAPEEAEDEDFDEDGRYLKDDFIEITEIELLEGQIPYSEESVTAGSRVFEKACAQCHGDEGRGNITSGKRLADDWEFRIWPRNLSKPWTWRVTNVDGNDAAARDQTIHNIYRRLSIGISGTPMPAHRTEEGSSEALSLENRWHVANYVFSLREGAAPPPGQSSVITGASVTGILPDRIDDPVWEQALPVTLRSVPNIIKEKRLFTPLNNAVTVQVLYNEKEIAFLLEVDDRTDSRPGEEVSEQIQDVQYEMSPDAFAIQFPKEEAYVEAPIVEKPHYQHGDATHPTTIWYWNAGSIEPEVAAMAALLDASGPDQKLVARKDDQSLSASGRWEHGRWRVIMKRPRASGNDQGDIQFNEGRFIPVSFANWDGSNGEKGSRHTLTTWYWLLLPSKVDKIKVYGLPLSSGLLAFFAGLLLVRSQRSIK